METGRPFSAPFIALFVCIVFYQTSYATSTHKHCPPSSCGSIPNISYPFRLKTDPKKCGEERFSLSCENNNTTTVLYLNSTKYYVQAIDYSMQVIRVVDSNIVKGNCSSIPRYSLAYSNLSYEDPYIPYMPYYTSSLPHPRPIILLDCKNPVNSPLYIDTAPCHVTSSPLQSKRYSYVWIGRLCPSDLLDSHFRMDRLYTSDLPGSCRVELMVMTSMALGCQKNISYLDVHSCMGYGFELQWYTAKAGKHLGLDYNCYAVQSNRVCHTYYCDFQVLDTLTSWNEICDSVETFLDNVGERVGLYLTHYIFMMLLGVVLTVIPWIIARILIGIPCVIALLMYKWKRRHLSMYDNIEEFLQSKSKIMPLRYSYSDIKKMSKGFKEKLGEGGFGCVYKGKLRSGSLVAIKMLDKSKANNGQDFINEVATIGRIHHVNVVQLIGFCVEGSKRALVYDFMPNGSLDKYVFLNNESSIDIKKMHEISVGVASGIQYLHQGCNMQILHFDIKPHNILLDEDFSPKVSDFGLARLCPLDDSIVSLTAPRGTMGYIAPELFYKNIGRVSYKADVYSFGMLLMEMASRRKNLNAVAEHISQIYFPSWAYDQINEGKDLTMEDSTEEESKLRMKMIMVALWCIQTKPTDRPSMNKVKDMLEGEIERLQMPPKPFLCPEEKLEDANRHEDKSSSKFFSTPLNDLF